jgi:hypothetical protein
MGMFDFLRNLPVGPGTNVGQAIDQLPSQEDLTNKLIDLDPGGVWRYNMTTLEKDRAVERGEVPGQPRIDPTDPSSYGRADRYGAGYYLQKAHPTLGPLYQGVGDLFHPGDELQPYAHLGAGQAQREQLSPEERDALEHGVPSKKGFFRQLITGGYR